MEKQKIITINVTQRDINKQGNPRCPVALALKRKLPKEAISVGHSFILIGTKQIRITPEIEKFVLAFDSLKPVKPSKFRLEI